MAVVVEAQGHGDIDDGFVAFTQTFKRQRHFRRIAVSMNSRSGDRPKDPCNVVDRIPYGRRNGPKRVVEGQPIGDPTAYFLDGFPLRPTRCVEMRSLAKK